MDSNVPNFTNITYASPVADPSDLPKEILTKIQSVVTNELVYQQLCKQPNPHNEVLPPDVPHIDRVLSDEEIRRARNMLPHGIPIVFFKASCDLRFFFGRFQRTEFVVILNECNNVMSVTIIEPPPKPSTKLDISTIYHVRHSIETYYSRLANAAYNTELPLSLAYTLNHSEIEKAKEELGDRIGICFCKHNYTGNIRIYYFIHEFSNFIIGINNDNIVTTVTESY
jgi:hypothetical protein